MQRIVLYLAVVLLLSSCGSNRGTRYYNAPQEEIHFGIAGDSCIQVEVAYIGALGRHFIFETSVQNRCSTPITIDQEDFVMWIGDLEEAPPVYPEDYIRELREDQVTIKKRKKTNMILAIIGAGASIASGASVGLSVGETLVYAAEPLAYVVEDNQWANRNINSIDDEIQYLNTALFDHHTITAGEDVTKDVLFRAQRIDDDIEVVLFINDLHYAVSFDRSLFDL